MTQFLGTILASVFTTAALAWLLRTWISERLRQSIKHEYDRDLSAYQSALNTEIERARSEVARLSAIEASAAGAFQGVHVAGTERRARAVEEIWKATVLLRMVAADAVLVLDLSSNGILGDLRDSPEATASLKSLSFHRMLPAISSAVSGLEEHRPFIGENVWLLFSGLQALLVAMSSLYHTNPQQVFEWNSQESIRMLLQSLFTKEELEAVDQKTFTLVREALEKKIAATVGKIVSGESSGEIALEQAQRIRRALDEVDQSKQKILKKE